MPTTSESTINYSDKDSSMDDKINESISDSPDSTKRKKYKLEKMLSKIIYTNIEKWKNNIDDKKGKSPPPSPNSKKEKSSSPRFSKKSSKARLTIEGEGEKVKRYNSEPIFYNVNSKIIESPHPLSQRHSYDSIFDNIKEKQFFQCSVDKLTEKLIDPEITSQNRLFIHTFITTHQYFICSSHLLRKLVELYKFPVSQKESKEIYLIRVINIIKKLLEFKYFDFKDDETFASCLRSFLSSLYSGTEKEKEMATLLTKTMVYINITYSIMYLL